MEAALERQAAVLEGKALNRVRAGLPVDPVRIMTQLDMYTVAPEEMEERIQDFRLETEEMVETVLTLP